MRPKERTNVRTLAARTLRQRLVHFQTVQLRKESKDQPSTSSTSYFVLLRTVAHSLADMSSRRQPPASRANFDDDVDDAALDDLLGSDTENVSSRISKGKSRPSAATKPAAAASARRSSVATANASKGDWDDNRGGDVSAGSDDERPTSLRKSLSRPLPNRNRALPTKKPSASSGTSGSTLSLADDLDSALFGVGSRSTLSASAEEALAVQRPRSRSRTLDARRDDSGRPLSAQSGRIDEEDDDWDAPSGGGSGAKASEKQAEESRAVRGRPRSGLSIDDDVERNFAQAAQQQEEHKQPADSSAAASDDVNDRRARYRDMMQKRREERASLSVQTEQPALQPQPQIANRPSASPPLKSSPSQLPVPADDPWSSLDDPLSTIGEQPSAADKIAQSLAAFGSGPAASKEQPMPMARTQPVTAVTEDSASALGGRRPRAAAGRRAAGLSASPAPITEESYARPATAPALPAAAVTAPLPAALKVEVTTADLSTSSTQPRPYASPVASLPIAAVASSPFTSVAASAPPTSSLTTWCQWLGLDATSPADQPLLVVARRAAAQSLPAHISARDGAWHNSRTGRRTSEHPALGKWRRVLEQKQLAIKYNVDDDDSDEDEDSFWRDVNEQQELEEQRRQQQQQQQGIPAEVVAVMAASPTLSALTSSPFSSQASAASSTSSAAFAQSALPSFMTHSMAGAAPSAQHALPMSTLSLSPMSSSASSMPSATVLEEALAQQRTSLTREFQQQLGDAIAHQIQLNTLTAAQRGREEEDRRRREDERHRHEVAALREQLYDSRVMRGLTESIQAGVRGVEELREQASDEKKQREGEREQAHKLREELLAQREKAVEQSLSHYEDKRKQAEAEARSYQQEAEAVKREKAALLASLQAEREELRLQRRQLQSEKELLMAEKDKYISESGRWERARAEQHDMVAALREMTERKHRQAEEELERARDDRAAVMAQLDGEKEEWRVQRELMHCRRQRLEADERKVQTARDELALREAEVSEQVSLVQRLGVQLNRQSAALVNERRQLDDEQRQWGTQQLHQRADTRHKRAIEAPYYAHASFDAGVLGSGGYTPTAFFAPFMASTRLVDHARELSAADMKLLECESEALTETDGGEAGWNGEWISQSFSGYDGEQREAVQ